MCKRKRTRNCTPETMGSLLFFLGSLFNTILFGFLLLNGFPLFSMLLSFSSSSDLPFSPLLIIPFLSPFCLSFFLSIFYLVKQKTLFFFLSLEVGIASQKPAFSSRFNFKHVSPGDCLGLHFQAYASFP